MIFELSNIGSCMIESSEAHAIIQIRIEAPTEYISVD